MDLLHRILSNLEWAIAGLFGAIVSVPFHEELSSWKGKLFFVFTGIACAYFLTPFAMNHYSIDPGLSGGVGFLLGAFGGSLLAAVVRAIKAADLVALIKAKFGSR